MRLYISLFSVLLLSVSVPAFAQKIVYSDYEKDDSRRMNFEIIGKVSGNFLVYKGSRNKNHIVAFNNDMEQIAKEEMDYIPEERLINIDFFPYNDHSYMVYQYQKKKRGLL